MPGRRSPREPLPPPWSDIVVAATTPQAAARLRFELQDHGCAVSKVEGRNVYVPWTGDEAKLRDVFDFAVQHGHSRPDAVATAVQTRLAEIRRRRHG